MAQKANPVSLRLKFNRNSDSNWFSDYYYTSLLFQDIDFHNYFNSVNKLAHNRSKGGIARCILHNYPKRSVIHWFILTLGNNQRFVQDLYQRENAAHSRFALSFYSPKAIQIAHIDKLNQHQSQYTLSTPNENSGALTHLIQERIQYGKLALHNDLDFNAVTPLHELLYASGWTNAFVTTNTNLQSSNRLNYGCTIHNQISKRYDSSSAFQTHTSNEAFQLQKQAFNTQQSTSQLASLMNERQPQLRASVIVCMNYVTMAYWFRLKTNLKLTEKFSIEQSQGSANVLSKLQGFGSHQGSASLGGPIHSSPDKHLYKAHEELSVDRTDCSKRKEHSTVLHAPVSQSDGCFRIASHMDLAFQLIALKQYQLQPLLAYTQHHCLSNIQSVFHKHTNTLVSFIPVKTDSIYQSASLVAQDICNRLEQKKSFRQICRLLFQQVESCQYIKGVRICCSGRFNGAEIAKTEWKHCGETSLHMLSNQIDYAHAQAFTAYGTLGVKVWISYL